MTISVVVYSVPFLTGPVVAAEAPATTEKTAAMVAKRILTSFNVFKKNLKGELLSRGLGGCY